MGSNTNNMGSNTKNRSNAFNYKLYAFITIVVVVLIYEYFDDDDDDGEMMYCSREKIDNAVVEQIKKKEQRLPIKLTQSCKKGLVKGAITGGIFGGLEGGLTNGIVSAIISPCLIYLYGGD